jgi:hypothetical protein
MVNPLFHSCPTGRKNDGERVWRRVSEIYGTNRKDITEILKAAENPLFSPLLRLYIRVIGDSPAP